MSLRIKLVLIYITVLGICLGALYLGSNQIILSRFTQLEEDNAADRLLQIQEVLDNHLFGMDRSTLDWAFWDESVRFLAEQDLSYVDRNLAPNTLANLSMDVVVFFRPDGSLYYIKQVDTRTEQEIPVSPEIAGFFAQHSAQYQLQSTEASFSGIALVNHQLFLTTARPIIPTNQTGPISGVLVFGRLLDPSLLSGPDGTAVQFYSLTTAVPGMSETVFQNLSPAKPTHLEIIDNQYLDGFLLVTDLSDQPVVWARVRSPRSLYQETQQVLNSFHLFIGIIALFVLAGSLVFVNHLFIARMVNLERQVRAVRIWPDRPARIDTRGNDELAHLSRDIGQTLQTLQQVRQAQAESEAKYRHLFTSIPDPVFIIDQQTLRFLAWNPAAEACYGYSDHELIKMGLSHLRASGKPFQTGDLFPQVSEAAKRCTHRTKAGKRIEVEMTTQEVAYQSKPAWLCLIRDVTERQRAEDELRQERDLVQTIFDATPDALVIIAPDGSILDCNRAMIELLHSSAKEELINQSIYQYVSPELMPEALSYSEQVLRGQAIRNLELQLERSNSAMMVEISASLVLNDNNTPAYIVLLLKDITDRKKVEEALRDSEERYRSLVEDQGEGISILDSQNRFIFCNPAGERIFGAEPGQLLGRSLFELVTAEDQDVLKQQQDNRKRGEKNTYEITIRHSDGALRKLLMTSTPWLDEQGNFLGSYGLFLDISERKRAEEQMEFLGTHDILTGLYNRAYFSIQVERLEREQAFPISVIIADVNHLKTTNDTLGHAAGDELLRQAANVLRSALRSGDIIARLGGDEFGVLLPGADEQAAQQAIKRIKNQINHHNRSENLYNLSVAIGAGTALTPTPLADLVEMADQRMYEDKARRRLHYSN